MRRVGSISQKKQQLVSLSFPSVFNEKNWIFFLVLGIEIEPHTLSDLIGELLLENNKKPKLQELLRTRHSLTLILGKLLNAYETPCQCLLSIAHKGPLILEGL